MRTRVVFVVAALALTAPIVAAAPPTNRSYSAGSFGLELEGQMVGFIKSVEGGNIVADVVKEPAGEEVFVKKHLANPGVRDIDIEFGPAMGSALFNWMKAALNRQYAPKNGAILTYDYKLAVQSRLEFSNAQITQITFPALDASSKEPIRFAIRITPAATTLIRKVGGQASKPLSQKTTLASSFRLSVDGLDATFASAIEELKVDLPLLNDPSGACRFCEPIPVGPIDFPNVIVTMAESKAASFYQWLDDFLIQGNNDDSAEKGGTLEYLSPTYAALAKLTFSHLGIFEIAPVPAAADSLAKVQISMYCERIDFDYLGPAN